MALSNVRPNNPSPRDRPDAAEAAQAAVAAALRDYAGVDLSWIQPPPTDHEWSLAPDALQFLFSLVRHLNPGQIVEFGTGLSTRVLARAWTASRATAHLITVDNDPACSQRASAALAADPQISRVRFVIAPLVARSCLSGLLPNYLLPTGSLGPTPADLVLIDGPPSMLGGRAGMLYQAMDLSRPGTVVLLDDARREAEQAAIADWQAKLGADIDVQLPPGFVKGLAVIIIRKTSSSRTPARPGNGHDP